MYSEVIEFIKEKFSNPKFIPLHEPKFIGKEKEYLNECIDSTFVSYLGKYVTQFEEQTQKYTGAKYALATVNGTAALQLALIAVGVETEDEVITQALTFVATANAISYLGAKPLFVDVNKETLGLCPDKLEDFLLNSVEIKNEQAYNKRTGKRIAACMPMHTFGHPCKIEKIVALCNKYHIPVVEDAAESLGSTVNGKHTGTFGNIGVFSYNGNKTITCGGGGMLITDDKEIFERVKHISTTAKVPHKWEYVHDEIGYNYRMPNVNAAVGCAQMEQLEFYLANKRELAQSYISFFENNKINMVTEPVNCRSNYWLNAIILDSAEERELFLKETNENGVMTRPIWQLMNKLEMFRDCEVASSENAEWLVQRIVNIPSGVRI
jgi:perosamine synthetase